MGGVRSGLDALELLAVGATAVALGTVLFGDPSAPDRVRDELTREAAARGFGDPADLHRSSVVQFEKTLHIAANTSGCTAVEDC
jgi:dihydroorotate dehydrogenase